MLKRLDDSVGHIRSALKDLGVAENTVIIFTSDNGCVPEDYRGENDGDRKLDGFKPGQKITSAAPLRGEKGTLFEGGIRVPTILYVPGTRANGTRTETPMITYDLFPTILALAGLQPPPNWTIDGTSMQPALEGKQLPDRPLIWHYPHYVSAPPSDKYPDGMKQRPAAAIRMGPWKLIYEFENGNSSLFNIAADPGEEKDLASGRPDTIARLRSRLLDYLDSVKAQLPQPNPKHRQAKPTPSS
jgi:arylsulfatase A-like enzyme